MPARFRLRCTRLAWPSSSSAKSIRSCWLTILMLAFLDANSVLLTMFGTAVRDGDRQCHKERSSRALGGFQPDTAAVTLDHAPYHDQADALAFGHVRTQSLESLENLGSVGLRDAETVILHEKGL